ncbi:fructose-bisphosphate aldolase [bacterium]|nr:fructose-bisphosphate aldolase [bacterium]MBU4510549.1 fructose-bisphosphate aldolase [bacterium]
MTGKELRLSRIFRRDGKVGVFAFDHGQHFGTVEYPKDPIKIIEETVKGGIDALLLNPGVVKILKRDIFRKAGLIVRITGGATAYSKESDFHSLLYDVDYAVSVGADMVAMMLILGSKRENEMISSISRCVKECDRLQIPLLVEVLSAISKEPVTKELALGSRVAFELGADVIKTYYTGEDFDRVVSAARVPLIIAGGPKTDNLKNMTIKAMEKGAKGFAFGRNIFSSASPRETVAQLVKIVHK